MEYLLKINQKVGEHKDLHKSKLVMNWQLVKPDGKLFYFSFNFFILEMQPFSSHNTLASCKFLRLHFFSCTGKGPQAPVPQDCLEHQMSSLIQCVWHTPHLSELRCEY